MIKKETFLQGLLQGPSLTLLHNLLNDVQYWRESHARLAKFVDHAIEDLPGMLKEDHADMFLHNTPRVIFHFIVVCMVIFKRFKVDIHVAHRPSP